MALLNERIIDYVGNISDVNDLVEISPHHPYYFLIKSTTETHIQIENIKLCFT